ncbi:hypothetical protein [Frankia sp. Cr1]|uniref:hypothetical protein n=1 Tax=Frankia sp. Cr1 TaxID=3073931 RepID=UPI002AD3C1D7|nr:hypothetical protein [Frankia sp. Cr1]
MTRYQRDLLTRVAATVVAALLGLATAELSGLSVWWAVPAATLVTSARALATSTGQGSRLTWDVLERTLWTAAQSAAAVVPVTTLGWPPELIMVFSGALSALKGLAASGVGDPHTAALLPAGTEATR